MQLILVVFAIIVTAQFCAGDEMASAVSYLEPNRQPAKGYEKSKVTGVVRMLQKESGGHTLIQVEAEGLTPDTPHGFHIHALGDIYSKGCQSTSSHYNPFHKTHGAPSDEIRHVGDLGNVMSDEKGTVKVEIKDRLVSLVGTYSVYGRAFVLHALSDDLGKGNGAKRAESLKTGNAGARLACGIIVHAPVENVPYEKKVEKDQVESHFIATDDEIVEVEKFLKTI